MAIDTSGKWWLGSEPADTEEYLRAYSEDGYPIHQCRHSICDCGSNSHHLEYHDDEGIALRVCSSCRNRRFLADSEENAKGVRRKKLKCVECRGTCFNISVGFALFEPELTDVKWVYVGYRCTGCGVLGCSVEWKISYSPSMHLIESV